MYVFSVNTLIGGNLFFLELYLKSAQLPEGTEQCNMKLTQTEHQLAHQHSEFMMSPVYVCTRNNTVTMAFHGN